MSNQTDSSTKPRVFIGSSSAGLDVARDIQINLKKDVAVKVWDQEDWQQKSTLERLMEILTKYDFAILVLRPDDTLHIKGKNLLAARDNVLLELGLFMGRLGREKTFIVLQSNETDELEMRIPSDLLGINFAIYTAGSESDLDATCSEIRKRMLKLWAEQKEKASAASQVNPLTYEARMLYRILNAASFPQYKPIDTDLLKPMPIGEQSFANIENVRVIAEELFHYYMFPYLRAAQNEAQRLRVYFAYFLGDGVPLDERPDLYYCLGRDEQGNLFRGPFVIGVSTSEGSTDEKWKSGLPLKGYEPTVGAIGRALSNGAEAFRKRISLPIDDTDNPPTGYKHLNFKVEDERAVYSVPVLLSDKRWNKPETIAPIGVLTVSGSEPNMINDNIKKRADHLAILLGFIFYMHVKQNPDAPSAGREININNLPVGFVRGNTPDLLEFVRRAVALRREVAKHFEEYFLEQQIHKLQGQELSYTAV